MEHAGSRRPPVTFPSFSRSGADRYPEDEPLDADDLYRRLELHQLKTAAFRLLDLQDRLRPPPSMMSTPKSSSSPSSNLTGVLGDTPTLESLSSSSLGTSRNISDAVPVHRARSVNAVCKDRDTTSRSTSSPTDMSTKTCATVSPGGSLAENRRSLVLLKASNDPEISMQDRRRTLQTVSELASKHSTPFIRTKDFSANTESEHQNDELVKSGEAIHTNGHETESEAEKKPRPKSIRVQLLGPPTQASVATTPPTPKKSTRRYSANDFAPQGAPESTDDQPKDDTDKKAKRFSLRFSLRGKSSKDPDTQTQRAHADSRTSALKPQQSNGDVKPRESVQRSTSKGKQLVRVDENNRRHLPNRDIFRERREWERTRREKAVLEAKARREREGRNLIVGSPSTLPSMSPLPPTLPKSNSGYARGRMSQQFLLQNSRTMTGNRPATRQFTPGPPIRETVGDDQISAQLLKRVSTSNISERRRSNSPGRPISRGQSPRRRSTVSESRHSSRAITHNNPMAVVAVKGSPNVYPVRSRTPNSRPSSQHFMTTPNQERRPRSLRSKSYNQSRASSAHSAISAAETTTSHGTRLSRRSASPATSSHSRRRHRREITKEHLHALAALTAPAPRPDGNMTAESIAFFDAQQKKLDEKRRRESVASERAMRISLIEQENRSRATSRTRSIYHYRPPTASSNGVPTMPEPSMTHSATIEDTDEATMANESIRLLREREKLVRWKAEREKVDFERKQRDKIRERVRRANEMEEERSKALEKQQHKKKKRGWCGSRRE